MPSVPRNALSVSSALLTMMLSYGIKSKITCRTKSHIIALLFSENILECADPPTSQTTLHLTGVSCSDDSPVHLHHTRGKPCSTCKELGGRTCSAVPTTYD